MKKSLYALTMLLGMGLTTPASALEIGDIITPAIVAGEVGTFDRFATEASGPVIVGDIITEAVLSEIVKMGAAVEDTDFADGVVINSTIAKVGQQMIHGRTATQADVDAGVRLGELGEKGFAAIGDVISIRKALLADVTAGAMVDSTPLKLSDIFKNGGSISGFVITDSDVDNVLIGNNGIEGNKVFDRIATDADIAANVYTSGTIVSVGDPVFVGVATDVTMNDSVAREATDEEKAAGDAWMTDNTVTGTVSNAAGQVITVDGHVAGATEVTDANLIDQEVKEGFFFEAITQVNGVEAVEKQMIAARTASTADFNAKVIIFEDGVPREVTEADVTAELIIPAREATAKDVEAGALIDGTDLVAGDLYFDGYADADDVAAKKTTGNTLVELGDIILSRDATAEDIAAGVHTGGNLVAIGDLIPGAIVVTPANVKAGGQYAGLAAGDIIFPGVDVGDIITEAKIAGVDDVTDGVEIGDVIGTEERIATAADVKSAVLATADDVLDFVLADLNETEMAEFNKVSNNLSSDEKLASISLIDEIDQALINSEKTINIEDSTTIIRTSFALAPDTKAFNEYRTAMQGVVVDSMTVDEIRTKINPDAGSGAGSAIAGMNAISGSIGNHQMNLVANSGKYGPKKYLASLDSGLNSGSSSMNTSAWGEAFISDSTMDTRDSVAGYSAGTHGVTVGVDTMLTNDSMLGFAFSYANIDVDGESVSNSRTDTDQFQGTIYGSLMRDIFFINGSLSYAHGDSDTSRDTFGGKATGSYGSDIYSVGLGVGMPITDGDMTFTPQTSVQYSSISTDSYTENGPAALNVSVADMDMLILKTGISFEDSVKLSDAKFIPKMRLLASWDILRESAESTSSWVSTGTTIVPISGPKPSSIGGSVGVGFDYATDDGLYVISLDYDMDAKSDFVSHAGTAKLRVNF